MLVKLNAAGEDHLKSLIDAGKFNTDQAWDFSAEDGDKLLGDGGDDWERYSGVHLGEDADASENTKGRYEYPAAKAKGDSEEVYREGLIAAKQRAAQQGEKDIEDAAGRLVDLIDKKDGKGTNGTKETASAAAAVETSPVVASVETAPRAPRLVSHDLPRIFTRIFETPLLIDASKLDVILAALGPRLNLMIASPPVIKAGAVDIDLASLKPGMLSMSNDDGDDDPEETPYTMTPDGIAILDVDGTLVYKSGWLGALSGLTSYSDVNAALDQALADPSVKGILLQIDSYGGEANGCFDLCDAIFAARSVKPIFAVAADDSYSGAYALASAASKVFVSRTSGVGSIGVVCAHVDQSGADKMDGLKYTYIYSGDHKIDGNPHEPLTTPALEAMQAECDRLRLLFAGSVARYRGLSLDDTIATQAAKFFGENAVAAKLADAVGTPADALNALRVEIMGKANAPAMPAAMPALATPPASEKTKIAAPTPATADIVDLAAMREKLVGDTTALHVEIVELCALADQHQLATNFIRNRTSITDVRKQLQVLRAEASDTRQTQGHIMPDAGDNNAQTAAAGWEKAFAKVRGRAKEK